MSRVLRGVVLGSMIAACGYPRPADVEPDGAPGGSRYQLLALEPAVGVTGDTITLEGTFDSSVMVNFPGGISQSATVLGEHRATVVVPETATAGKLSVATGGTVVGALEFRHASFPLGLQNFRASHDQANGARQESVLVTARSGTASAVVQDYLYVIGGVDSTGYLKTLERARINADGSLGPFTISNVKLVAARAGHTCLVVGIFLYVVGGTDGTGALGSVEQATIEPDGSLGPFAMVPGVTLGAARKDSSSVVLGNSLYMIGGAGSGVFGSVERATINADGSLRPFITVSGVDLVTGRTGHTSAVVGNTLYVIGGSSNSGIVDTVERAAIAGDGSLGTFALVPGAALTTARTGHTSARIGRSLYVVGGVKGSGELTSMEQAEVHADGSLGAFTVTANAITAARSGHSSVTLKNSLYLLGGSNSRDGYLDSIEFAEVNVGSALGAFSVLSERTLMQGGSVSDIISVGSSIYVLKSGSIERATIGDDGSLGPFVAVSGTALDAGYSGYATAVVRDKLLLIGGTISTGQEGSTIGAVRQATFNADGSLSAFSLITGTALVNARSSATAVVVRNSLYVIAGYKTTLGFDDSIERASINSDGSLGAFVTVGNTAITGRIGCSSIVIGDFLYLVGGSGTEARKNLERAPINSDGSLGQFTVVPGVTPATGRYSHMTSVIGRYLYLIGGSNPNGGVQGSVERAAINGDSSLGEFTSVPVALELKRAVAGSIIVGNRLYVLGGFAEVNIGFVFTRNIEQAWLQ